MSTLGLLRLEGVTAERIAARSRWSLDRALRHDAELVLAAPSDGAVVLGSMQRASEIAHQLDASSTLTRRGSGGAEALVGPGTLWMQLSLARADALVACPPSRLLNRYVRPLLRALTKVGALAHYFDRDWVSAGKQPVAVLGFAHDGATGRALVEALIAVSSPFALRVRPSYLGRPPATLADLGAVTDVARLMDAVALSYADAYGRTIVAMDDAAASEAPPSGDDTDEPRRAPSWAATRVEGIGVVAAGRDGAGRMRIGGELMASRDAVARLEERLATLVAPGSALDAEAIGRAVDESFAGADVALLGVKSLVSLRDVILEAFAR